MLSVTLTGASIQDMPFQSGSGQICSQPYEHGGAASRQCLFDIIMGIGDATKLTNVLGPIISGVISLINGGDSEDAVVGFYELTRPFMMNVFNPNTPDMPGVYYQSYAGKITNALGGGLLLAIWEIMKPYEGDNDGTVSVTSAKWEISGCL